MTKQKLEELFANECTTLDEKGHTVIKGTPMDIINWISDKLNISETTEPKKTFRDLCKPLMVYLADNHHPHCTVILTSANAELTEGVMTIHN